LQAIPLLSGTPDRGSYIVDSGRDIEQHGSNRQDRQMAIELSMYDIVYKPRTVIKAQALSDFVAEWTEIQTPPKEKELEY
jgi:hypothetical protein